MSTPLVPQEVYLLERYSSVEYFADMRDAWQDFIDFLEIRLTQFTARLPANIRSRPLPLQADIVWGQRVLPNFRYTAQLLNDAFVRLTHGDANALRHASAVTGDVKGQYDFSLDWLDDVAPGGVATYWELLDRAELLAANVGTTGSGGWLTGLLSYNYSSRARGELRPPAAWPRYTLDESVQVGTGDSVPESGIYLPEVSDAAAQFLIGGHRACPAKTGFNGQQYMSKVPTIWKRVRRIEGETVADGLADLLMTGSKVVPIRAQGGLPCPKEGWWFTPSQAHSRRYFCEGEVFPIIEGSAYGSTFWQWDRDQDEPRLR